MGRRQAYVDPSRCVGSVDCPARAHCPAGAIFREEEAGPFFVGPECLGCGRCITYCRWGAISLL
ncbi:MAG: 4Fe-4S ferredoxin [Moorellaceae bacterium]